MPDGPSHRPGLSLRGLIAYLVERRRRLWGELTAGIDEADGLVYELYEIPAALRAVVEREYEAR